MSWFDTSNLANIASKAMKEAQKTLDKALDIEENEQESKGEVLINLVSVHEKRYLHRELTNNVFLILERLGTLL